MTSSVPSPNPDYLCTKVNITKTPRLGEVLPPGQPSGWYPGAILEPNPRDPDGFVPVNGLARNPVRILAANLPMDTASPPTAVMDEVSAGVYDQEYHQLVERALRYHGVKPYAEIGMANFTSVDYDELETHGGLAPFFIGGAKLIAGLDWQSGRARRDILSLTVVEFTQVYYSVTVDPVGRMDSPFTRDVSGADVVAAFPAAPVYVSSIKYGRKAVLVVDSAYASSEVEQALNAFLDAARVVSMVKYRPRTSKSCKTPVSMGSSWVALAPMRLN